MDFLALWLAQGKGLGKSRLLSPRTAPQGLRRRMLPSGAQEDGAKELISGDRS